MSPESGVSEARPKKSHNVTLQQLWSAPAPISPSPWPQTWIQTKLHVFVSVKGERGQEGLLRWPFKTSFQCHTAEAIVKQNEIN